MILLISSGLGCTGLTQNPSYFPFYLPTGDIVRTHAKPPGRGYFADFDRKAVCLDLQALSESGPVRAQHVLIATVSDDDGDGRRTRRVEWVVEGPGNIIEVDESGFYAGRGYKVDNKYAVSYTDYKEHTIDRGNDNPRDDFTVKAGQTWCVVSCAVPGETVVTAYAPGVHNWEKGRKFVTLRWGEGGLGGSGPGTGFGSGSGNDRLPPLPPPGRSSSGSDADLRQPPRGETASLRDPLDLSVNFPRALARDQEARATIRAAGTADTSGLTLRTYLPDGLDYLGSEPPAVQRGRELIWVYPAGNSGPREVQLRLRPTRTGAMQLVAIAETVNGLRVERTAQSNVDTAGLKASATAQGSTVTVSVTNTGSAAINNVIAWITTDGVRHRTGANPVEVNLGTIDGGRTVS
ncbi:MAG: hypothetical protein ACRCZF_13555, partial [Gemmataceae bacterium]